MAQFIPIEVSGQPSAKLLLRRIGADRVDRFLEHRLTEKQIVDVHALLAHAFGRTREVNLVPVQGRAGRVCAIGRRRWNLQNPVCVVVDQRDLAEIEWIPHDLVAGRMPIITAGTVLGVGQNCGQLWRLVKDAIPFDALTSDHTRGSIAGETFEEFRGRQGRAPVLGDLVLPNLQRNVPGAPDEAKATMDTSVVDLADPEDQQGFKHLEGERRALQAVAEVAASVRLIGSARCKIAGEPGHADHSYRFEDVIKELLEWAIGVEREGKALEHYDLGVLDARTSVEVAVMSTALTAQLRINDEPAMRFYRAEDVPLPSDPRKAEIQQSVAERARTERMQTTQTIDEVVLRRIATGLIQSGSC